MRNEDAIQTYGHTRRSPYHVPILGPEGRFRVIYLAGREERRRTAWFSSRPRAEAALVVLQRKYGRRNAIIYVD